MRVNTERHNGYGHQKVWQNDVHELLFQVFPELEILIGKILEQKGTDEYEHHCSISLPRIEESGQGIMNRYVRRPIREIAAGVYADNDQDGYAAKVENISQEFRHGGVALGDQVARVKRVAFARPGIQQCMAVFHVMSLEDVPNKSVPCILVKASARRAGDMKELVTASSRISVDLPGAV